MWNFACLVKIKCWTIRYGLDNVGGDATHADMELDGKIYSLRYRDFNGEPSKSTALVKIIFTDDKDESFDIRGDPWDPGRYIGALYVSDNRKERRSKDQFFAEVNIILPWAAFTNVALMKDKRIMLDTTHEVLPGLPTKHAYAYVRRVNFNCADFKR